MPPRKKVVQITIPNEDGTMPPPEEAPKKRERKSKKQSIVAVVTPDGIQGSFLPDMKRPLIVHLPIHSADVKFHDQPLMYDPTPPCQPEAFNAGLLDPFSTEAGYEELLPGLNGQEGTTLEELDQENRSVKPTNETIAKRDTYEAKHTPHEYGPTHLLVQREQMAKTLTLPEQTDVACFWCCETFPGRPCVIPRSILEDEERDGEKEPVWQVYGNFCTPQCAMAYLLSELLDTHVRWERIALLNQLYGAQCKGRVYPAPNRETLTRFGGPVSSESFRTLCEKQCVRIDVHQPPMVSILASMDTKPIDFYETPVRTNLISPIHTNLHTEDKTLKLKRSKPLKNKESTLDTVLQIRVTAR